MTKCNIPECISSKTQTRQWRRNTFNDIYGGGAIMAWGFFLQWKNGGAGVSNGRRLCGNNWVFQQDNALVHNARRTRDYFQENNITILDHPAASPDLNPVENLWGWMARKLHLEPNCFGI
uniref:Tc1-like transposase DDE domain-containing protein n=1 Tax=Astatotilapia calliptera TaxID=8154 RepID=A0AAX7TBM0_ASTCA